MSESKTATARVDNIADPHGAMIRRDAIRGAARAELLRQERYGHLTEEFTRCSGGDIAHQRPLRRSERLVIEGCSGGEVLEKARAREFESTRSHADYMPTLPHDRTTIPRTAAEEVGWDTTNIDALMFPRKGRKQDPLFR